MRQRKFRQCPTQTMCRPICRTRPTVVFLQFGARERGQRTLHRPKEQIGDRLTNSAHARQGEQRPIAGHGFGQYFVDRRSCPVVRC